MAEINEKGGHTGGPPFGCDKSPPPFDVC